MTHKLRLSSCETGRLSIRRDLVRYLVVKCMLIIDVCLYLITWSTNTSLRVGWRHATAMSPYTDSWKIHRKNITKIASTNVSVSVFDRIQEVEAAHFLLNLLDSPENLFDHIRK